MIKHFPIISPFARKRRVTGPPEKAGIDRWFKTREDYILPDNTGNGRPAEVKGEASYFGGDGVVEIANTNNSPLFLSFKTVITTFTLGTIQSLYNTANGINGLQLRIDSNGKLRVVKNGIATQLLGNSVINNGDEVGLDYNSNSNVINIYINGLVDATGLATSTFIFHDKNYIGCQDELGSTECFIGSMNDIVIIIDDTTIKIPLPHAGVGFDSTGNTITLPITGGVTSAIVKDGSLWNHIHGCVARNPELVAPDGFTVYGAWVYEGNGIYNVDNSTAEPLYVSRGIGLNVGITTSVSVTVSDYTHGSVRYEFGGVAIEISANGIYNFDAIFGYVQANTPLFRTSSVNGFGGRISDISITLKYPSCIPNKPNNTPAYPLQIGDTFHAATHFLNGAPMGLILYTAGDTDPEYTFWNKDLPHWDDDVRNDEDYRSGETGFWSYKQLNQAYIFAHCLDPEKNKGWIKQLPSGMYKDIFYYRTALQPDDDLAAAKYCKSVIPYEYTEGPYLIQEGAYYIIP